MGQQAGEHNMVITKLNSDVSQTFSTKKPHINANVMLYPYHKKVSIYDLKDNFTDKKAPVYFVINSTSVLWLSFSLNRWTCDL